MSNRIVSAIVAAAVSVAIGFTRPTPNSLSPAIAASLCSRLRHHYASQRRQLRLEGERSGRHKNGHALLPDRATRAEP